ncbi:MAG: formate--phosphoribosylaminoimidazolecarboxamide ligase [Nitrosopumilaceae archaeon]|nr:formate--phosphoribosylaminoimidazolecarboxamide ligase [Nitrosopumilaceae archaeon]
MKSIATLGSHCALQLLKGAKEEKFKTILICEQKREKLYKRFNFIDHIIVVNSFKDILEKKYINILNEQNAIIIPHGTLISQLTSDEIESINVPMFGNKWILRWEADRIKKEILLHASNIATPKKISSPKNIDKLSIVKKDGAAGGAGYFLASDKNEYEEKLADLIDQKMININDKLYIQEYALGVLVYLQYFYSESKHELEFFGIDRRHESNIDGLSRIPAKNQAEIDRRLTFNVIGNSPMVLRESLLDEVYAMGERFVSASKKLVEPGMIGPFCIEGVYDNNGKFTAFEFSARIVAGTNMYIDGSPYSSLLYDEKMSMGKRIAREIRDSITDDKLKKIVS